MQELLRSIINGEKLSDKLVVISPEDIDWNWEPNERFLLKSPKRENSIQFSDKQLKFPKGKTLSLDNKKAQALNSFANHELLAIEMMATALLIYPHHTDELKRFKRGVLKSLIDEQKHFKLYRNRMQEIGYDFGDFPLNDFFWKQMEKLKTPSMYLAVMSLTFEAANLDFAHYYQQIFKTLMTTVRPILCKLSMKMSYPMWHWEEPI
jgi:uncharacterized ferritin-like protein (DUF455 family)